VFGLVSGAPDVSGVPARCLDADSSRLVFLLPGTGRAFMPAQLEAQTRPPAEQSTFHDALRQCFCGGIITLDSDKRVRAITHEAARCLGCLPQDVLGRSWEVLPAGLRESIARAWSSNSEVSDFQTEMATATGQPGVIQGRIFRTGGAAGDPGLSIVIGTFSTSETAGRELMRLDRLVSAGTLSAGVAHDIKNALVASKTFIDLLLERNQDAELAETVVHELSRIELMLNQLLRFAGPARPLLSQVHLHRMLDSRLKLVQSQVRDKGILVQRDYNASPDRVLADENQLEQVFMNLVLNALEAMGSGGELRISTELVTGEPPRVAIRVQDNGPGIPSENLEKLFEPFFTTKEGGTGLGLAMARRIVAEHGGEISVQSESGRGSTFSITLPVNCP
jgi:signal transduction histidine kinase